jgi:8-oxo-dGTP pyrophosphatase MutT (NUDIX family)
MPAMSSAVREPARHFVTLKAAVWKGDRLLLVHEDTGEGPVSIDLPGGRIEREESIEAGLRREIREELGVEIARLAALPRKLWATCTADGVGVVGILYEAELASQAFDHSGALEVVGATFLSYEELVAARGGVHKPFIVEYFRERRGF